MPNLTRFPPVESATGGLKLYGRKGCKSRVFCCQCGERIVRTVNALDKKLKNEDIVKQQNILCKDMLRSLCTISMQSVLVRPVREKVMV